MAAASDFTAERTIWQKLSKDTCLGETVISSNLQATRRKIVGVAIVAAHTQTCDLETWDFCHLHSAVVPCPQCLAISAEVGRCKAQGAAFERHRLQYDLRITPQLLPKLHMRHSE